ncbi:hypothetical protein F2P56_022776, partial [Juglans regia]
MATNGFGRPNKHFRPPALPLPKDTTNLICLSENSHVSTPLHWKKAAEAMQCNHFDEVCSMVSQFAQVQTVDIQGTTLTVGQVTAIARRGEVKVNLNEAVACERVAKSANWVAEHVSRGTDTYGVTTGFGATSHRRTNKTSDLQTELIRFLNAGVIGRENLPSSYTKAAMLVRTNTLMQGFSGIRWEVLEGMAKLMNTNLTPKLPLRGTITASGDLVPLSYIAGLLTGRHNSKVLTSEGEEITAMEALTRAGISAPFELQAKEGLALVNGTAVGSAVAATVCFDANILALLSELWVMVDSESKVWMKRQRMSIEAVRGVERHSFPVAMDSSDITLMRGFYSVIYYNFTTFRSKRCFVQRIQPDEVFPFQSDLEPAYLKNYWKKEQFSRFLRW